MNYKIISDSASNLITMDDFAYESVPLHIIVGEQSFTDDGTVVISQMYDAIAAHKGTISTACPSPEDWVNAFGDAEAAFCVTITSGLSGSYNSAHAAKDMYEEEYPDRKIYLIDSRSTGPEMVLLINKLKELIQSGLPAEEVYQQIMEYHKNTHLLYSLASLNNLAKNGRVNTLVAKGIGILGIRVVGTTTEEGTLKPLDKVRGDKKAFPKLISYMKKMGYKNGKVYITHTENPKGAEKFKQMIIDEFGHFNGYVQADTALCSYYAEPGSVLVGFESF